VILEVLTISFSFICNVKNAAFFLFVVLNISAYGQFAPQAGMPGSTAIYKDSSIFKSWANSASVTKGLQQINDATFGLPTVGDQFAALGKAGENGVVSLGDGGSAVVSFYAPIFNGPGADFAVFENSFLDSFLELAFVEVSTDGNRYVRFPAVSNTQDTLPIGGFGLVAPTALNNLAGKFRANYGTPFDLEELKDSSEIDISNIQFVRLIDVVGSMNDSFATKDINGHKINDPWPTPFPSSGFDLDAVGVIHTLANDVKTLDALSMEVFPTITQHFVNVNRPLADANRIVVTNALGQEMFSANINSFRTTIDVSGWETGIYWVLITSKNAQLACRRFYKAE
jgi:hypothetical protein